MVSAAPPMGCGTRKILRMGSQPSAAIRDILVTLRANQWTKNAVVTAAFFFALGDRKQSVD